MLVTGMLSSSIKPWRGCGSTVERLELEQIKASHLSLWKPNYFLTFRSYVCIGDDGWCCDLWCSVVRLVGCSRLLRIRRTFGRPWKSRSQSLTCYGFFEETLGCLYAGLPPLPSVALLICSLNSGRRNHVTYTSVV